jgi:hypothetical protein
VDLQKSLYTEMRIVLRVFFSHGYIPLSLGRDGNRIIKFLGNFFFNFFYLMEMRTLGNTPNILEFAKLTFPILTKYLVDRH